MNYIPGIFNDVIEPVMRGPFSAHYAVALPTVIMCSD